MDKLTEFKEKIREFLDDHEQSLSKSDMEGISEGNGEIFRKIKIGQVDNFRRMLTWAESELDKFIREFLKKDSKLYPRLYLELLDCAVNDWQKTTKSVAREFRLQGKQFESDKNDAIIQTIRALQLKTHSAYNDIYGDLPAPLWKRFVRRG